MSLMFVNPNLYTLMYKFNDTLCYDIKFRSKNEVSNLGHNYNLVQIHTCQDNIKL